MKDFIKLLWGLPIVGAFLVLALVVLLVGAWAYGIVLAFSASIVLGIIVLLVEPSPTAIGLVMIFFHKNLAQMLIDFLNK